MRLLSSVLAASLLAAACHRPPPVTPVPSPMTQTPPVTWPALNEAFIADAAATMNFRLGTPAPLHAAPDGSVLFRRTGGRTFAADLYSLAPDGTVTTLATVDTLMGANEEKLSNEEKARRERLRIATRGVVAVDLSDDGSKVLVPLGGRLHLIERTTGKSVAIDPGGAAFDPRLSPDGSKIAFVRDGKLVVGTATQPMKVLYTSAPPANHEDGTADFAAQEELKRTRGFWWSPDSKEIVFQRTDNSPIDTIWVSDARHPENEPVKFKYPRAGRSNAKLALGVIKLADKKIAPRWLAWPAKYEYLVSVTWPEKGPLSALVIDRDQVETALYTFDAKGTAKEILVEKDDAWLNVDVGAPKWLADGSGFLWMTEKSGEWELELRDPAGAVVRPLTPKGFGLRTLAGTIHGAAIVTASTDPVKQDVWRVPLDGSTPSRMTNNDGWATVSVDANTALVHTGLSAGGVRVTAIDDKGTRELPSAAERPSITPTTKLETVTIGGRTHHVAITRPQSFDPTRTYPVLLKVYAGPHVTTVMDARDNYVLDQWYADAGFIVVRSDNRGTPYRGREWERAILEDLITVPLQDQVDALHAVGAKYKELDLGRVGVFGWSFGGYFSTMAVLLRPDVFHAGVAGAPVTDWQLYDTAYTERYMKTPAANVDGYKRTSALTHAEKLSRPLLLIHGITDDNVHFAHTLAFVESLFVAAKRAEVITLSGTHMVPDPRLNLAREQVQVEFFRKNLAP